jgi:hypothetical protein
MSTAMSAGHPRGGVTERPRYYARQLITPAELNLEATYFVERLRRHNRLLHGWGVVCGALVCRVPNADGTGAEPWKVKLTCGHILDPFGNEIAIVLERTFDLRAGGVTVALDDPPGELTDPWCSDVWTEPEGNEGWVAVRYHQSMARPVRVQPAGCGCDDTTCEYSRWCDGYEVRLLDHCPTSYTETPPLLEDLVAPRPIPECPPYPTDPWVVLAHVEFDVDGNITAVDNCGCRRMVVSLADAWWKCTTSQLTITKVETAPAGPFTRGQTGIQMTVTGTNIDQKAAAQVGQGVKVTALQVKADGTAMTLTLRILNFAQAGDRALTVTNPDCKIASAASALTISASPTTPSAGKPQRS